MLQNISNKLTLFLGQIVRKVSWKTWTLPCKNTLLMLKRVTKTQIAVKLTEHFRVTLIQKTCQGLFRLQVNRSQDVQTVS